MAGRGSSRRPLPTKEQLLAFIRESRQPVGKREIARAFGIRGADRVWLKDMLRELSAEGELGRGAGRRYGVGEVLPRVAVLEISGIDIDGELLARPVSWTEEREPPRIVMAPERGPGHALGPGDRVLARLSRDPDGSYEARTIRRIPRAPDQVFGLYATIAGAGRIVPTERGRRQEYRVEPGDSGGAERGELVLATVRPGHHLGLPRAQIVERLGAIGSPRSLSLIAIHNHGIPTRFSDAALAEAEATRPVRLGSRVDLRALPLVTIDPEDARDHDDAVWAAPDDEPANAGGWRLCVAIADVAHYVRPGSALDHDARLRGNSTYFPDRVVPMLPEALSSDLCSLMPGRDRPVVAAEMRIDKDGNLLDHRFVRGLMRSAASLDYAQVQAAADGAPDDVTGPLLEPVLTSLYGAYAALRRARAARRPLEIVVPERKVVFDAAGGVAAIRPRAVLDSHRLIEEFMIAANVVAAESLSERRAPCMYRIHEAPDAEKLEALRELLDSLGHRLAKGQVIRPAHFNAVLAEVAGTPHERLVNQAVLRTQSQAFYAPDSPGHFGLALARYAHFTSPIRRYADLLVHRALIAALGLGKWGLPMGADEEFPALGQTISAAERRSMAAERDAMDRYAAAFLADRVGESFAGYISGVTRFGLFITLEESGGDGLVPMAALSDDYYEHDERAHALIGRNRGRVYRLGDAVEAKLVEADPVTGSLGLELVESEEHPSRRVRRGPGVRAARRPGRRR